MLDRIEFMLGEAFVALRRNGLMTFAAISTIAVSLFLIGGLGYVYFRIVQFGDAIPSKFEMRVFLRMDAKPDDVSAAAKALRAIPGVKAAVWIPKDKAWEKTKRDDPAITEGLDNPLPEAFKVTISDLSQSDRIAGQIRNLPQVDEKTPVSYMQAEQDLVEKALVLVRWLGSVFGGLLFLTGGILIYNAIRLTVLSRRLEIRIMTLIGASKWMVQAPFVIEGVVQGALGGLIAAFLVLAAYRAFSQFMMTMSALYVAAPFPLATFVGLLMAIGALYGLICSSLAVRAPFKFR